MGVFDGINFDDHVSIFQDGIDYLLENGGLNCQIIYSDRQTDCPNCEFDSFNNRSAGYYTPGGPVPFNDGDICPWCNGAGILIVNPTETIKMILIWNPKDWVSLPQEIKVDLIKTPNAYVQTWGYSSDIPKLFNAKIVRMEINKAGIINWDFRMLGEPAPQGFKNSKYFVCMWERIGG